MWTGGYIHKNLVVSGPGLKKMNLEKWDTGGSAARIKGHMKVSVSSCGSQQSLKQISSHLLSVFPELNNNLIKIQKVGGQLHCNLIILPSSHGPLFNWGKVVGSTV